MDHAMAQPGITDELVELVIQGVNPGPSVQISNRVSS